MMLIGDKGACASEIISPARLLVLKVTDILVSVLDDYIGSVTVNVVPSLSLLSTRTLS